MTDRTDFKRMNFFTGFFTTAADWNAGQDYHLAKRRLHNRTLHTPGILRDELQELQVVSGGGLTLEVRPGAALDAGGREIYLSEPHTLTIEAGTTGWVYVAIEYSEYLSDWVENVQQADYSGYTRYTEEPKIQWQKNQPDNEDQLELARVDLKGGLAEIAPDDIQRAYVRYAGSVEVVEPLLDEEIKERLITLMQRKRKDFAGLDKVLPTPSNCDVRSGALNLEILARSDNLREALIPEVLTAMWDAEQDIVQDLGEAYPRLNEQERVEYTAFVNAVAELKRALDLGSPVSVLLSKQDDAALRAQELSQIQVIPTADAGPDTASATTHGDSAIVQLDAGDSDALFDIVRYHWRAAGP